MTEAPRQFKKRPKALAAPSSPTEADNSSPVGAEMAAVPAIDRQSAGTLGGDQDRFHGADTPGLSALRFSEPRVQVTL
jgi:hypothetical protein